MPVSEHILRDEWQATVPPICPDCGYDLRGLQTFRCPECGARPTHRELRRAAEDTRRVMDELESLHGTLRIGWWIAAFTTAAIAGLAYLDMGGLVMILGLLCGVGLIGTGGQALAGVDRPGAKGLRI